MELDPERRAFLEAAVAPLGKDDTGRELLAEALAISAALPPGAKGDSVAVATRRMQATGSRFHFRRMLRRTAVFLLVLPAAWMAVCGTPALHSIGRIYLANRASAATSSMCCTFDGVPGFPEFGMTGDWNEIEGPGGREIAGMPERSRLLLFGDHANPDPVARWKKVWDEYPQSPEHYFAYALAYHRTNTRWPEDMVETGERLDPGNGWFRLAAGMEKLKGAVGEAPIPRISKEERLRARAEGRQIVRPAPSGKPEKTVLDAAALADGLRLIDEALSMPVLEDYRETLNRIRFEATPAPEDFAGHLSASIRTFFRPEGSSRDWLGMRAYHEASSVVCKEAAKRGDVRTVEECGERSVRLAARLSGMRTSFLLPALVMESTLGSNSRAQAEAWSLLGRLEQSKSFEFVAEKLKLSTPLFSSGPPDAIDEHRASGAALKAYKGSPYPGAEPVTEEEVRGGRMAERVLYRRFMVHVAAVLFLLVIVGLGALRFVGRKRSGLVPARLAGLLKAGDWAWIFLAGTGLPLLVHSLSMESRWLDSREFGLDRDRFHAWLAAACALPVAVALLTFRAVAWRLGRRGSLLFLGTRGPDPGIWLGWLALLSIPAAIAGAGWIPDRSLQEICFWTVVITSVAAPWLWLGALAVIHLAGNPARLLHRAVLIRASLLPPCLAFAWAALQVPQLAGQENHWAKQMDYEALKEGTHLFAPRTEMDHAAWLRQQILPSLDELRVLCGENVR